jgi:hypothetical protein
MFSSLSVKSKILQVPQAYMAGEQVESSAGSRIKVEKLKRIGKT